MAGGDPSSGGPPEVMLIEAKTVNPTPSTSATQESVDSPVPMRTILGGTDTVRKGVGPPGANQSNRIASSAPFPVNDALAVAVTRLNPGMFT